MQELDSSTLFILSESVTPARSIRPVPLESVNQEFWLGRKNYKSWKLQKDWKLQETFLLLPKAQNSVSVAASYLGAMKWSWASKMDLLSVIIEQSATKRSLLISFCKMLLLVLLYQLHLLFHQLCWKQYFFQSQR